MPTQLFSNNAQTVLAAQLSAGGTLLTVANGDLFRGPVPALGQYELITLINGYNYEVVKCTQRGALVAEVKTATPGGTIVPATSLFTLELYDSEGVMHTLEYLATASTVASVVTGLYNAWIAKAAAPWNEYTVADQGTQLQITHDTAGVPFTLTEQVSGGGSETFVVATTTPAVAGQGNDLTIVRAQEGTTARQWEIGETVSGRVTRGTMEAVQADIKTAQQTADANVYVPRPKYYDYGTKSANFNLDVSLAETIRVKVAATIDITLINGVQGETTRICLVQDATGSRDVDFTNISRWQDGNTPALVSLANKMDVVGVIFMPVDGVTNEYVGMAYTVNL